MFDVAVVGAGPVGLFLGCRLALLGVSCRLLDRRSERHQHSRSIGIHPPALEVLETVGVTRELLTRGVQVRVGRAFSGSRPLGTLSFESLPPPFRFVLTLPQDQVEAVLERRFCDLAPGALGRGVSVGRVVVQGNRGVIIETSAGPLQARLVVGCDGPNSTVRAALSIPFRGGLYPDAYVMGDFADSTGFGTDACIFLTDQGVVESFPLPGRTRRWVVKTDRTSGPPSAVARMAGVCSANQQGAYSPPTAVHMAALIHERVGIEIDPDTHSMLSAFGTQRFLADRFSSGPAALAGDAAHVISPIGGQGMNLGWLDAYALSSAIDRIVRGEGSLGPQLASYSASRRRAARCATYRAELNMRLGRVWRLPGCRDLLLKLALATPAERVLARLFTMQGLA